MALAAADVDTPRLDAELLLAEALGVDRARLVLDSESALSPGSLETFEALLLRRVAREPVAYILGRRDFRRITLAVDRRVLIPRPETELLVEVGLGLPSSVRVADVGTGSGCLAIACTHQHRSATFIAIDISPEALAVARANADRHAVSGRIEFRPGDLLEPVAGEPPFDLIVSNPPYIPTGRIATLEAGVRDYEPHAALDGGPDGLRLVSRLIDQAIPLLKPGGHLILEIGTEQEEPVRALIEAHGEYRLAPTIRDFQNHPRVIRAVRQDTQGTSLG
jgi:release factor glutamine methyltransferase